MVSAMPLLLEDLLIVPKAIHQGDAHNDAPYTLSWQEMSMHWSHPFDG